MAGKSRASQSKTAARTPPRNMLRVLRKRAGIAQIKLADMLGVSRKHVFTIEDGTQAPSLPLAIKIRDVLGCTLDELFPSSDETEDLPRRLAAAS